TYLAQDVLIHPPGSLRDNDEGHPELPTLSGDLRGDVPSTRPLTLAWDEHVGLLDRADDGGLEAYLSGTLLSKPYSTLPVLQCLLEVIRDRGIGLSLCELEHVEDIDLRDAYLVEDLTNVGVDDRPHPPHCQFHDVFDTS